MDDNVKKLVLGGLLHDIGKVVQRSQKNGNAMTHSKWGEKYLKEIGIEDAEILQQVAFHHNTEKHKEISTAFKDGIIKEDSLAFITYCADNIASGCDRRFRDEDTRFRGFKIYRALHSVFNSLNGEKNIYRYGESRFEIRNDIPYPENAQFTYKKSYYLKQLNDFEQEIKSIPSDSITDEKYINVLISLLEKYFTFMPDCTSNAGLADISLYDHIKMTAAFGSCMYLYAEEKGIKDYHDEFLTHAGTFYKKKAFQLLSLDLSGIQKFVYTIPSHGALKNLRARSFYINSLMEFVTDQLLERVGLSRANVLYIGGGHVNLLLPNIHPIGGVVKEFISEINSWLMEYFGTTLYLGFGYHECSAYDFRGKYNKNYREKISFRQLCSEIQAQVEEKKKQRYTADIIRYMNPENYSGKNVKTHIGEGRECKICHSSTPDLIPREKNGVLEYDVCPMCNSFLRNANKLPGYHIYADSDSIRKNKDLFLIEDCNKKDTDMMLFPFGKQLKFAGKVSGKPDYIYNKNSLKIMKNSGMHIWVADYINGDTLEEMAQRATGINRIAVIRADVDNLGESFVSGFAGRPEPIDRDTVSRKATYSRLLALFFQYYINGILEHGDFSLDTIKSKSEKGIQRNAAVVYSGGDDLFIVGGWDDIIGFAVDLYQSFRKYTQCKLTLSAGIGIYPPKYPISSIAVETGRLEMQSKLNKASDIYKVDKDSITLFSEEFTFHWECFINKVLGEKYVLIKEFFDSKECGERGITFLHRILCLLKSIKTEQISLARYAFLMARLEPKGRGKKGKEQEHKAYIENYKKLKEELYAWMSNACDETNEGNVSNDEDDVKQCIVAIYLYLYLRRKDEDGNSSGKSK